MAMTVKSEGAGGGEPINDMNVVPLIDVLLVLLIIFMVAAPLATVDVAVDLPVSTAEPQPRDPKPIFLTLKADHTLALGETTVANSELGPALDAGATHLLLDNMAPDTLRQAVAMVGGRVPTEASGGISLDTIRAKAETGVTYVSVGRITQSAPAADIGLDFSPA